MSVNTSPSVPEEDDLTIPDFLRVENRQRLDVPIPTRVVQAEPYVDPVQQRQNELRASIEATAAAKRKAKNARGFELMQEKHPNERYVRPKKKDGRVVVPGHWVPK